MKGSVRTGGGRQKREKMRMIAWDCLLVHAQLAVEKISGPFFFKCVSGRQSLDICQDLRFRGDVNEEANSARSRRLFVSAHSQIVPVVGCSRFLLSLGSLFERASWANVRVCTAATAKQNWSAWLLQFSAGKNIKSTFICSSDAGPQP